MRSIKSGVLAAILVPFGFAAADSQDPLADAIAENDVAEVRLLLADGEYVPADAFGYLSAALRSESTLILEALLDFGVPPDARADGALQATAMMYAAYMDRPDMMQVLADAGADIDMPDEMGDPAINWAAYGGKAAAVAWLLQNGARTDQAGHGTALEIAKRRGFTPIVGMIAAVDLNVTMDADAARLAAAIDANDAVAASALAGLATMPDETGRPLFHRAARQGRIEIVWAMLESGVDVDLRDDIGFTALMEAARDGHVNMVSLLLEHGADPNIISSSAALKMTPIHLACVGGDTSIITALHDAGASLDAQDTDGTTAVIWALGEGHREAADLMLALGADPDLENRFGDSARSVIAYLETLE